MKKQELFNKTLSIIIFVAGLILINPGFKNNTKAETIQTTVIVHVCGNGAQEGTETCDSGSNNGKYANSTASRYCNQTCDGWAPYCGDHTSQSVYGEECDDGNNSGSDGCSAACKTEQVINNGGGGGVGGGGGGGGGGETQTPIETKVVIKGKAYPGSLVHILKDGIEITSVPAAANADFTKEVSGITPGVYTFSIWAVDADNIKSITYSLTFRAVANTITTVSGIYLPPTIGIGKTAVKSGEILNIFGQTTPGVVVDVNILSTEINKTVTADDVGAWLLAFDTSVLEDGNHTTKAKFRLSSQETSGFGKTLAFYVGDNAPSGNLGDSLSKTDFNSDGKVNLVDFSIFLNWWRKPNDEVDLNGNGIVDLPDFSIFLLRWTG